MTEEFVPGVDELLHWTSYPDTAGAWILDDDGGVVGEGMTGKHAGDSNKPITQTNTFKIAIEEPGATISQILIIITERG